MLCKRCGTEIREGWKLCPSCGNEILSGMEGTECREYKLKGMRRTGRFSFQEISTDIKVEGESVHVITQGAKKAESQFRKQEVQSIDLPVLPIWKISDILRLVMFGVLAVFTYGLSIFAILFSIKIMVSRHVRIKLKSGKAIKIPIRQKADASGFLKEFQYPLSEIEKNNAGKIEDKKWAQKEWITSAALLAVAAGAITLGATLKSGSMQNVGTGEAMNGSAGELDETEDTVLGDSQKEDDYGLRQKDKNIPESTELDISSGQVEPKEAEGMDTGDIEMYLDNGSEAFPVKVENVSKEIEFTGFTTIAFDMANVSESDVKEATFGIAAWDSNMLPLGLVEMYGIDPTYFYKCQASNIAAGQTSHGSLRFEERDFKYIQVFLLECSDFDGNIWTNPATSYYEENFAGKKFDENTMPAMVFGADNTDEMNGAAEGEEDTVGCTGDFYTDVANGILYGKDGGIVDVNGNVLPEYAGYFVTEDGYISNGDWVEEGYVVDSTGKIIAFQW